MSEIVDVSFGRAVQRHELDGLAPQDVAKMLGHKQVKGVSIEPGHVVIHVGTEAKLRQVRHPIGG